MGVIYSLVQRRIEDVPPGSFGTGVTRFDQSLRELFPDLVSITPRDLPEFTSADVVIADNHLSLMVPEYTPTVVVHHGCARTHYERDPDWRTQGTANLCDRQRGMLYLPNRLYVAPSAWVRDEFARHYGLAADYAEVIVNYVEPMPGRRVSPIVPVVLGDWRDTNKGAGLWRWLAHELPQYEFRQLQCQTGLERARAYLGADVWLCLSLSEGGSYAMCDAEAFRLGVVSTDVGNAREFECEIIERDWAPKKIGAAIERALDRSGPSYFEWSTYMDWVSAWRSVVRRAREGGFRPLLGSR